MATSAVNQEFVRMDVQWIAREPGWYQAKPTGHSTANPKRVCGRKDRGSLPRAPVRGGAAKATTVLVQPGSEQQRDGKRGERGKGVRRKLVLV